MPTASRSGVVVESYWNVGPLQRSIASAFRAACGDVKVLALAKAWPENRKGLSLRFSGSDRAILRAGGPLAHLQEGGAHAHEIPPGAAKTERTSRSRRRSKESGRYETITRTSTRKKSGGRTALKFTHGDGGFSRAPVQHPGFRAEPFLHPAAAALGEAFNVQARRRLPRAVNL